LEDYKQVKKFINKLDELELRPPFVFYNASLIHFIEDYQDCLDLKNKILQTQGNRRRRFSILFIQQIMLSKSEEQAINIIQEANAYGIKLGEAWTKRYDSMWRIKNDQEAWKENIMQLGEYNRFPEIFENFNKMKIHYFESLSLKDLTQTLLDKQSNKNNRKMTQTAVYDRSVYIKEFARKVANGICQLCDNEAPFRDKQGNLFLEVHHIHYLSQGGCDTIDNVVALCPNCHRKIHHLELDEDYKKLKQKAVENINI
ncbi:HNH endonuclease, partial [Neobacillus niacini]|uniref:HNH endonuclease n=1 Tax=Neobacillus niacini TaxID=86668 RepID=UPI00300160E7